jgi:hypothetical protein
MVREGAEELRELLDAWIGLPGDLALAVEIKI